MENQWFKFLIFLNIVAYLQQFKFTFPHDVTILFSIPFQIKAQYIVRGVEYFTWWKNILLWGQEIYMGSQGIHCLAQKYICIWNIIIPSSNRTQRYGVSSCTRCHAVQRGDSKKYRLLCFSLQELGPRRTSWVGPPRAVKCGVDL